MRDVSTWMGSLTPKVFAVSTNTSLTPTFIRDCVLSYAEGFINFYGGTEQWDTAARITPVCVYVCMCVCVCMCVYVCMCVCVCMYVCMHTYV